MGRNMKRKHDDTDGKEHKKEQPLTKQRKDTATDNDTVNTSEWLPNDLQSIISSYNNPYRNPYPRIYPFGETESTYQDTRIVLDNSIHTNSLGFFAAQEKLSNKPCRTLHPYLDSIQIFHLKRGKVIDRRCRTLSSIHLLEHVVRGEAIQAEYIVKNNPALAFEVVPHTVIDYSDHRITKLSPFQKALCDGDNEMAEMMKKHILQAPNSQVLWKTMQRQFCDIFPGGIKKHVKEQINRTFNFNPILRAIMRADKTEVENALKNIGASFNDKVPNKPNEKLTLIEALNRFRHQFAKCAKRGKIFNPQHLQRATNIDDYLSDKDYATWKDKMSLFNTQVVGLVQRFIPVNYEQAFEHGILQITEGRAPLKRGVVIRHRMTTLKGLGFSDSLCPDGTPADLWALISGKYSQSESLMKNSRENSQHTQLRPS